MSISITKPTKTVEIVTDLAALQDSIKAARELHDYRDSIKESKDSEASAKQQRSVQSKKAALQKLVKQVDDSTLIFELCSLNASEWTRIMVEHTTSSSDRLVYDWPGIVTAATPKMLGTASWKTKAEAVEFSETELEEFIADLTDVQAADLIPVIRSLNETDSALPKDVRDLISAN
jgi:hypothetical protein